ncbi:hypothetical protein [uncultured Robinsoniella sp.]|jgi:hypothetical protein|uniref:hypothetical protein n=1 Tax=uncultured Robinsoniella sp. TaxID=904190 RepID=UPI00374F7686
MQEKPRFIYAVVHGPSEYIAYNGHDTEKVKEAAKYAEAHGIPYFIVRGEL